MPGTDLDIGVIYTGERELMPRLVATMVLPRATAADVARAGR